MKQTLLVAVALLCIALTAGAQAVAPAPATSGFVASSDALVIKCGSPTAGNLTAESYDLLDYGATKSNRIFAQGVELMAPGCGFSVYGGGLIWQPDLSALFKKTNLPTSNFVVFFDGSAGNGIAAQGNNRVTGIFGGGVRYVVNDTVTWNSIRFEEVFYGASRYPAISTGISAYFGGTPASPAVSPNVKTGLLKRMAAAQARLALRQ